MNYIVLDMEWNQPMPGVRLEYKNDRCLANEIIQIGAVKMDENLQIIDTFEINIKPQELKHINHNVRKLTGIDDALLADASDLATAIAEFRTWCGTDFVFLTWGYDDIGVLGTNLSYFGLPTDWLPNFYNLQMIFCAQTENLNKQYSLAYAAEHFGITLEKPLHDALTDAYYTALVCASLDLKKGIQSYRAMVFKDNTIPEHMKNIRYKRNYRPVAGYDALLKQTKIACPECPECGKALEHPESAKNGLFNYLTLGDCPEHGGFAESVKIHKTPEETYCATELFFALDRYNRPYFMSKVQKMRASDERRKKRTFASQNKQRKETAPAASACAGSFRKHV